MNMGTLNLKDKLNFNESDLTPPISVVEKIASQIEEQTEGIIKGKIKAYTGRITSYYRNNPTVIPLANLGVGTKVDIQDSLGKQGEETKKYEFYLSTPVFEKYRYRICFLEHGGANYPVKVVIEESIADEINKNSDNVGYIYKCENSTELDILITAIINSEKVIDVMQELIRIYQIHKDDQT